MKISIITPSFRNSEWLKLCVASVADQQGVTAEHIVQDACSDDGTEEWLRSDPRVKAFIEKDSGMYDAVNRGLRRSTGDILAYLNCDEQYLPGALQAVAEMFEKAPDVDIVLADTIVTDANGQFICCRKSLVPSRMLMWTDLPTLTAAIFFRRRLLNDFNLYFDVRWRNLGDVMWMRDALRLRVKMAVLRRYTSIFADTGENMNLKANAFRENALCNRMAPSWARRLKWFLRQLYRVRALSHGLYWEKPLSYSLYTQASPGSRVDIAVLKPTGIWWQRHAQARVFRRAEV